MKKSSNQGTNNQHVLPRSDGWSVKKAGASGEIFLHYAIRLA